MFVRASAIAPAGIVLSQPTSTTRPSKPLPRATSSIESAITSRLTSDVFMPSVFIVMPSEIAQVVIARADFNPGVRDADERLLEVAVGKADGLEHRARGRAARLGRGQ